MVNRYYEFLLEKQIYNLILEGKMIFSTDFIDILDTLSTNNDNNVANLASLIRGYVNLDVNLDSNCIDVSDKPGMVKFIPDNKIKEEEITYRVLRTGNILNYDSNNPHSLFKELDIPADGLINGENRNVINSTWKLIKKSDAKGTNWSHFDFYYLQDVNITNRYVVVYTNTGGQVIEPNGALSKGKSDVRLGRFVNKFIAAVAKDFNNQMGITPTTIEKFVNLYEGEIMLRNSAFDDFKIVEGEEIRKWYHYKYYEGISGQLSNSCMRYSKCQDFFDIYVENPKVCKLLIYVNEYNELRGRALLWTLSDGSKYMDRIYSSKDSYDILFLKWCDNNGYSKTISINSVVDVNIKDYKIYPYMDTFIYYNAVQGKLSNDKIFNRPYAQLDETEGEPDWRI